MQKGLHSRFHDLSAFVYTVETGSFTAAALRMGVSKSAPGKSVARLEERLGVTLLNRTTRSLSLTHEGRDYYHSCLKVLDELNVMESRLLSRKREVSGRVRINLPVSFGRLRIMPVLQALAQRYPALEFDVSFTDRRIDLVEERMDLVIRLGEPGNSPNLNARKLGNLHSVICASPEYLQRRGIPCKAEDLGSHDCLGFAREGHVLPWVIAGAQLQAIAYDFPCRHIISHGEALRDAAVNGLGIAYLATWLAAEEIRAGKLAILPLPIPPEDNPITALWPRSRDLAPKVRVVVDAFVEAFGPVAPWDKGIGFTEG